MIEIIEAQFRIVTPLFLGEASDQAARHIRPPALKGALRFWWRALNWARVRGAASSEGAALQALHREEAALFGHAAGSDKAHGQALFLVRVLSDARAEPADAALFKESAPLQYLLGQGGYSYKSGLQNKYGECFKSGKHFTLQLALKPGITSEQKNQLIDAVKCLGWLGNLGSRARKGFGSLSLSKLVIAKQNYPLPSTLADYKHELSQLLAPCQSLDEVPPFSAFSQHARLQLAATGPDAMALLERHGREMGRYRSFGSSSSTFPEKAEQNFKPDHDWAYRVAENRTKSEDKQGLPARAVFGLPHPYFLSGANINVSIDVEGGKGRRASPLLAHLHHFPSGEHVLVHVLLRADFLPDNSQVTVNATKGGARFDLSGQQVNQQIDWTVLENFLARFEGREVIHG